MKSFVVNSDYSELTDYLDSIDGDCEVMVVKADPRRTVLQLNYYWHTIVPQIRDGLIALGNDVSFSDTHKVLAYDYLYKEYVEDGVVKRAKLSLKSDAVPIVTVEIMMKYIDRCKRFASEELDVYIE